MAEEMRMAQNAATRPYVFFFFFLITALEKKKNNNSFGNSLAVQWLGLHAFMVQSLVEKLRSHKPYGTANR